MGSMHVKFHDDRCKGKAVMRRKPKCGRTDGRTWWFQYTPPNFVAGGITSHTTSGVVANIFLSCFLCSTSSSNPCPSSTKPRTPPAPFTSPCRSSTILRWSAPWGTWERVENSILHSNTGRIVDRYVLLSIRLQKQTILPSVNVSLWRLACARNILSQQWLQCCVHWLLLFLQYNVKLYK